MQRIQTLQQTPWLLLALPMQWTVSNIVVQLNKTGNSCGLISAETTLTVVYSSNDVDTMWWWFKRYSNLKCENNVVSNNSNETFSYYESVEWWKSASNIYTIGLWK
jgi:hypothetical protein